MCQAVPCTDFCGRLRFFCHKQREYFAVCGPENIDIEGITYQLEKPVLDAPLTFKKIERTTNTYMLEPNNDNMEDWVTGLQVNYTNEFWR